MPRDSAYGEGWDDGRLPFSPNWYDNHIDSVEGAMPEKSGVTKPLKVGRAVIAEALSAEKFMAWLRDQKDEFAVGWACDPEGDPFAMYIIECINDDAVDAKDISIIVGQDWLYMVGPGPSKSYARFMLPAWARNFITVIDSQARFKKEHNQALSTRIPVYRKNCVDAMELVWKR